MEQTPIKPKQILTENDNNLENPIPTKSKKVPLLIYLIADTLLL